MKILLGLVIIIIASVFSAFFWVHKIDKAEPGDRNFLAAIITAIMFVVAGAITAIIH